LLFYSIDVIILNIALNGSYKYYKGGRGHNRSNPKSWVEKELYYNLDFYVKNEDEDDEHPIILIRTKL